MTRVGSIEASIVDLLGYVLPGAAAVGIPVLLLDIRTLGGGDLADWTTSHLLVVAAIGYVVGHLFAVFQTQLLGQLSDLVFGHRKRMFFEAVDGESASPGAARVWARRLVGVSVLGTSTASAIRTASAVADMKPFSWALSVVRHDSALVEHERRLRALTIMFGNLVFACGSAIAILLAAGRSDPAILAGLGIAAVWSFLAYARYRLHRIRFVLQEAAGSVMSGASAGGSLPADSA